MRKMCKKVVSILLATAVTISGVAVTNGSTADAAKKTKTYTVNALFAGSQAKTSLVWIAGDTKPAKTVAKKVKITKGKKTNVSLTVKNINKKKVTAAVVCTVDLVGILKNFKKVKISNVVVKADGKKVKAKAYQGRFEPRTKPNNYRLSLFNKWGTDGDLSKTNKATNFAFKKKLTISFTVVAK